MNACISRLSHAAAAVFYTVFMLWKLNNSEIHIHKTDAVYNNQVRISFVCLSNESCTNRNLLLFHITNAVIIKLKSIISPGNSGYCMSNESCTFLYRIIMH